MTFSLKLMLGALTLLLLQGCGATLLRTSCDNPRVSNFGSPSSYIVMLPYRYGGQAPVNAESAQQLNQIARLQALQSAVEMPGTQITFVEGEPTAAGCGIENVYDRVVDNRSPLFWRRPYHSAIFVWGEIFDGDAGLIVQSHLRVFWNGSADRELEINVSAPTLPRPLRFGGELPTDTISFPAQRISRETQQRFAEAVKSGLQVRSEPRLDAPHAELPSKFSALGWKRPWLELQDRQLRTVWLLIDEAGVGSGTVLPETLFARAMSGYLNYRVDGKDETRQQTLATLALFRAAVSANAGPAAITSLALADVVEGMMGLPTPASAAVADSASPATPNAPITPQSQRSLSDAAQRLPTNGNVLNLAAIARIEGCCNGVEARAHAGEIQRMFERAEALERGNLKIASNLYNWYRYLATLPVASLPFDAAELGPRTDAAARSLAAWTALAR